jgi:YidC/Oxa1 family membrane protein insertase
MLEPLYVFFTNAMLWLYTVLGNNYVLALVVLTLLVRLALMPLSAQQMKQQKQMQAIQPKVKEVQEKYRNEPQKMQEEFQKIGYNPASMLLGCLPLLLQFPILIAMYRAIERVLPNTPMRLLSLYESSWSALFPNLPDLIPVNNHFLWMDLSQPESLFIPALGFGIPVLTILVVVTTFLQQLMIMPPATNADPNDPTASMSRNMMFTMPLMFGWMALSFASGLSIYFIVSNIATVLQSAWTNRENFYWQRFSLGGVSIAFPSFPSQPVTQPAKGKEIKPATTTKKSAKK